MQMVVKGFIRNKIYGTIHEDRFICDIYSIFVEGRVKAVAS